jgi:uncharacterized membrane protein
MLAKVLAADPPSDRVEVMIESGSELRFSGGFAGGVGVVVIAAAL